MKNIPELRHSRLRKLIERFKTAPSLILTNLFGSDRWDSDEIYWESEYGTRGMTPFGSEDAPAPMTPPTGIAEHRAHAAYWHEKIFLAASMLNALREPGSKERKTRAKAYISKQMKRLRYRSDRRKEWMHAKMLQAGSIDYLDKTLNKRTVSYGIPSDQIVTLASDRKWNSGTQKIVEDIMDAKITMDNANEADIDYALFPSEVMKLMVLDPSIQTLLQKSAFGDGDLMTRPQVVLGSLLGIENMVMYNARQQIVVYLTAALASGAGPHTVYVDETADATVGDTIYVHDTSAGTKEALTISAVDHNAGTWTATGTLSNAYKAIEDKVVLTKKYLSTSYFTMFSSRVEDQKIAELALAPFGIDPKYDTEVDSWEKKDPDGVYVRVQNKGLPVLYFPDAIYSLKVI